MKNNRKYICLVFLVVLSQIICSQQNEQDTINTYSNIQSQIIDHSDVQRYITSHAVLFKKKPFSEGFRIQIYNGSDRNEAQKMRADFYSKFSGLRCFLTYQQPYYRVRVGNYESPADAREDLRRMARYYPSSFLVPDQVNTPSSND